MPYETSVVPIKLPTPISREICRQESFQRRNREFRNFTPYADWLAICGESRQVVGIQLTCIVGPEVLSHKLLNAKSVSKCNQEDEFYDLNVLLCEAGTYSVEGWPLSTVYTLDDSEGNIVLYIPEFYNSGQKTPMSNEIEYEPF